MEHRRGRILRNVACVGALLLTATAEAQETGGSFTGRLVNWSYLGDFGGRDSALAGGYNVGGQSVQLIRVPPGFWIRDPDKHAWGLRLRLQVTFGVNEFTFLDEVTFDSLSLITLVPQAEFWLPLGRITTLRPYAGFGWGKDLKGSDWAWLLEAGAKLDIEPQLGSWELLVRPEVQVNASYTRTRINDDSIAGTFLKLDVLRPLWFDIGDYTPDASVYGQFRYYFDSATFGLSRLDPIVIDRQYEVGVTLGTRPRLQIWKFRMSRLHVAYRWGDGLSGIRIKIGAR